MGELFNQFTGAIDGESLGEEPGKLRMSFEEGGKSSPDKAARVLRMQMVTGLPQDVVEGHLPDIEARASAANFDANKFRTESPIVASWLAESPQHAALLRDEVGLWGGFERIVSAMKRGWENERDQAEQSRLIMREFNGESLSPLQAARRDKLGGDIALRARQSRYESGLEYFARTNASGVFQMLASLREQASGAGVAGSMFGVTAAVLDPTKLSVGPAVALGATVGALYGGAIHSYNMETPLFWNELRNMSDVNGQKLDPELTRLVAGATGVLLSTVEVAGGAAIASLVPGAKTIVNKALGVDAAKQAIKAQVKLALTRPTTAAALKTAAIGLVAAPTAESMEEFIQAMISAGGREVAQAVSGQYFAPDDFGKDIKSGVQQAKDAFVGSIFAMGAPIAASRAYVGLQQARQATQNEAYYTALGEMVANSKAHQLLPEKVQEVVSRITANGPVQEVYIDATQFRTYFQNKNLDPTEVARQVLGNTAEYEAAVQNDGQLRIPIADYATKIAPTEHNAFFAKEIRQAPDAMNAREADEYYKGVEKAIKEQVDKLHSVKQEVSDRLVATGLYDRQTADTMAAQMGEFFATQAKNLGISDPLELMARYGVEIKKGVAEEQKQLVPNAPGSATFYGQENGGVRVPPAEPTKDTKSEPGFVYHATSRENLQSISDSGVLRVFPPYAFTDQRTWPDGRTERRAYFNEKASSVHSFAPVEGKPVIVRTRLTPNMKHEIAGDFYSTQPIRATDLEYLGEDGNWYPVVRESGGTYFQKAARLNATGTAKQWINRNEKFVDWNNIFNKPDPMAALMEQVVNKINATMGNKAINQMAKVDLFEYIKRQAEMNGANPAPNIQQAIERYRNDPKAAVEQINKAITDQRKAVLSSWSDYLLIDNPTYAEDPFFVAWVWDGLTSDLSSVRPNVPAELDRAVLAAVYDKVTADPNNSKFLKVYSQEAERIAKETASEQTVEIGKGKEWIKIPQTAPDSPDFAANTNLLRALSCSTWCTSQGMEKTYIPRGDFWVLRIDGVTKLAIRFEGYGNEQEVAEIQGPNNDGVIPTERAADVKALVDSGSIILGKTAKQRLKDALKTADRINKVSAMDIKKAIKYFDLKELEEGGYKFIAKEGSVKTPELLTKSPIWPQVHELVYGSSYTYAASAEVDHSNLTSVDGDLFLGKGVSAPNLTSVSGDLTLDKGASAPNLTSVGGGLLLGEGASTPPNLISVGGGLTLYEGMSAPNLTSVGGNLTLDKGTSAPNVTSVGGNLYLGENASAPNVTSVGGGLILHRGASIPPNLTSMGGGLVLDKNISALNLASVNGNLYLHEGASAPNVTSVGGNLTLDKGASAPNITSVGGDLILDKGTSAPNVTSVGRDLILYKGAPVPNVTSVGRNLILHGGVSAPPNITSVSGGLTLYKGASAPNITSVSGNLALYEGASAPPNLTSVGGDLYLYAGASAPNLTSVGGNLVLSENTSAPPNLISVGGDLYLYNAASAPNLISVGGDLYLYEDASAPNVVSVGGDLYLFKGASAPNLTSVGKNLNLRKGASVPNITSVGGILFLDEGAERPPKLTFVGSEQRYDQEGVNSSTRGSITIGKDLKTAITLMENADLSTFLHESGHLYLEILRDLSSESGFEKLKRFLGQELKDGPQRAQMKKDAATIAAWLGASPDLSDVTAKQHEKFADGILTYLMEGKAPSVELRSVFARIRAWLVALYRTTKAIGVRLNPEVREVFARLFATQEAIAAAKAEAQVIPGFATAADAGMTDTEFAAYSKRVQEASIKAQEDLQQKVMQQMQYELSAEWKRRREEIRTSVIEQLSQQRAYQALKTIREDENKLSREALYAMYPGEYKDNQVMQVLHRMDLYRTAKGLNPQWIAETHGYSSADEMVRELINTKPFEQAVEEITDAQMKEKYGDIMVDGTLADKAREYVLGEGRSEILEIELRTLRRLQRESRPAVSAVVQSQRAERAAGMDALQKATAAPSLVFVRQVARDTLAQMQVRSINVQSFLIAARNSSKAALTAVHKGDYHIATYHKQKELLNVELYREAVRIKADVEKIAKYMRTFEESGVRQRLGHAGDFYLEQIDAILERFDFSNISTKEAAKRKSLVEWVEERRNAGEQINLPQDILNEAYRKPWKDMTYDELLGVRDAAKHIYHLATLKNKLLKSKAGRELAATINLIDETIAINARHPAKGERETRLPQDVALTAVGGFFAAHRKIASLAHEMDGFVDGGPVWESIIWPINEAASAEAMMHERSNARLVELFKPYASTKEQLKTLATSASLGMYSAGIYKKEFIPEINDSLSKAARLVVALNWGNESNRSRIMEGYGWTVQQVEAILAPLTKEDWDFVQGIWDHFESFWPKIEALAKRVDGVAPKKVQAAVVLTPFGEYRGGYFPAKYDDRQSPRAYAHLAKEAADRAMHGAFMRNFTAHGERINRLQNVKQPVRLDFGVIFESLNETIHDITHYETLIDLNKILGNKRIQESIIAHFGHDVLQQFRSALQDVAGGDIPAQTHVDKSLNWLRKGTTIAGMGWNLITGLMQPLGIVQSIVRIGPKWVAKGVGRWIGDAVRMENTIKWIYSKSDMMQERSITQSREINEIRNQLAAIKLLGPIQDSYFYLIVKLQQTVDVPTWLGAYEKGMEQFNGDEAKAVATANQAVLDSQGGGQIKDMAAVQRGGPAQKLWTNFYSFFNTTANLTAESYRKTHFKNPYEVGRFAVDMVLLYAVPAILSELIRSTMRGDDDDPDELMKRLAQAQLSYMVGPWLLTRELGGVIQGYHGYEGPAGAQFFAQSAKLMGQFKQGEADEAFLKALNKTSGILFHYPAGQVQRAVEGMAYDMENGSINPIPLLVGPPKE